MMALSAAACAAAPKVVSTVPDAGDDDVDPAITEIRVEFDEPIDPRGRSIVGGGDSFPEIIGDIRWPDDHTMIIPVKLMPKHGYWLSINSDSFKNFRGTNGEAVEWYPIRFITRRRGDAPRHDTTPEENRAAFKRLCDAIERDYSYRDRLEVDWATEFRKRRPQFENAATVNEFARHAAQLLRLAEDSHVYVRKDNDVFATRANSMPQNYNVELLRKTLPHYSKPAPGVTTARFDDGISYLSFSQCNNGQADAVDDLLDEMKDTTGLVLDVRFNGGGDELAAQKIAGRFAKRTAVYSKDRILHDGKWEGPFDRTIQPRDDRPAYEKQVVVLIGPKVVSSAESFVLMMKHGAGATLIGAKTAGSSGRPERHDLGNGLMLFLPSWEDMTPDGKLIEGVGVSPDVQIDASLGDFDENDPVLDAALQRLRERSTEPSTTKP